MRAWLGNLRSETGIKVLAFIALAFYVMFIPDMLRWSKEFSEYMYIRENPSFLSENPDYAKSHPRIIRKLERYWSRNPQEGEGGSSAE